MDTEIDAKTFWKAIGCRAIGVAILAISLAFLAEVVFG